MVLRILLVLLLALTGLAAPAAAQQASVEPLEIGPSGEAYLRAIRFRGIDSEVAYFDPTRPAPPLNTSENPRAKPEEEEFDPEAAQRASDTSRTVTMVITVLIVVAILYLFVKFGGAGSISFGRTPDNSARRDGRGMSVDGVGDGAGPANLQAILRMTDRREALVALSQFLLNRVVAAQGVLLQRSWTARDAMRRVPRDFDHRAALYDLVLASERVHFGGRDVTEEEFRAHLDRLRPLYSGGAA